MKEVATLRTECERLRKENEQLRREAEELKAALNEKRNVAEHVGGDVYRKGKTLFIRPS